MKNTNILLGLLGLGLNFISPVSYGFSAGVSFEKFERLNDPVNQSDVQDWFNLDLDIKNDISKTDRFRFETVIKLSADDKERDILFSLPQAYYQTDFDSGQIHGQLTFGRKTLDWNRGENYWGLNRLNPNQGFMLTGTEKEGLTGVLSDIRFGAFGVSVFGSLFYIPQLNPPLEVESGQFQSALEWVRLPPKTAFLKGVEIPLEYQLNKPKISDVVQQRSLGVELSHKDLWRGLRVSLFGVYKPESTLRANATYKGIPDPVTSLVTKAQIQANPVVNHHVLYGAYMEQDLIENAKLSLGFDVSDPNASIGRDFDTNVPLKDLSEDELPDNVGIVRPSYDRESYFYSRVETTQSRFQASLNYIRLLSSNERGSDDFLSESVKWKSAFGGALTYFFNDKVKAFVDYKYDLSRKDAVLTSEASWMVLRNLELSAGIEFIKAPRTESYWSYFRANDSIYSRLRFQF